jgi:hypothetical protein
MSIRPVWDNESQTILRHVFVDKWTVEELRVSAREAWAMMHTVPHTVHAILDASNANTLPSGGVLAITNRIATYRPANAGIIVIVTHSSFILSLAGTFNKIYGRFHPSLRYYVVASLEEARMLCYDVIAGETVETPAQPSSREAD